MMVKGQRTGKKLTVKQVMRQDLVEMQEKVDLIEEKHNQLVGVFIDFSRHAENMTTLLHLHLLKDDLATKETCTGCGMQVIYPHTFEEIQAFPVCPNRINEDGEEVEECLNGFSHIENPFASDEEE
tara:strand:+ start:8019 stop:8396 length:378 start_codon:yes stop_codon:yes gene_type:complete